MNPAMLNGRLSRLIGEYASEAMESRQVARRLADLLPSRLRRIRQDLSSPAKGSQAERLALTDERYVEALDELGDVSGRSVLARIQYETHSMLFQARQSLRSQRR